MDNIIESKVNLFIVGAPKCGTTSLYTYLTQHKSVAGGNAKEPHYFCSDYKQFRWFNDMKRYESNFPQLRDVEVKYNIDASVMYLYSQAAAEEIFAYNPKAKIVIMLREEESFYLSYHNQLLYNRDETISCPNAAWSCIDDRKKGIGIPSTCREDRFVDYKNILSYAAHVENFFEVFPEEQILIISFDKWKDNVEKYQTAIFEWLGLTDTGKLDYNIINEKKKHRYRFLSILTNNPPKRLLLFSKYFKKIIGVKSLNFAKYIRKFNQVPVTYAKLDDDIRREINGIKIENKKYLNDKYFKIEADI